MNNQLISAHEWAKKLSPAISARRVREICRSYKDQIGAVKMPGKTGAYLVPASAPDPRQTKGKKAQK